MTPTRLRAAGPGATIRPPPGYTQPDGGGAPHAPHEVTQLLTPDPPHSWSAVHQQYNGGRMDGFYGVGGANAIGDYTADELPLY